MRLFILGAVLLLASTACSDLTSPDRDEGLIYSGAFANWFYQTNGINLDAVAIENELAESPGDEGLRLRLRELATNQSSVNAAFSSMEPHPFWKDAHPGIVELTRRFDTATEVLRGDLVEGDLQPYIELFRIEEWQMLQAVITCYVKSGTCPAPPAQP